jgi:hypothetical protein
MRRCFCRVPSWPCYAGKPPRSRTSSDRTQVPMIDPFLNSRR